LESPLARYLLDYRLYSFISNPDEGRCVGAVLATKTVRFLTINANALFHIVLPGRIRRH
jgi:hypothetical protein